MTRSLFALGLLATTAVASPAQSASSSRCKEVNFAVSGSAANLVLDSSIANATGTTNLTNAVRSATAASPTTTTFSGAQTLAGWYCEPNTYNSNSTKLQVFRGSFFTNRESWTALGGTALFNPPLKPYQPQTYSWVDYANKLGYPTLAIDTLGDGASSRPNAFQAQIPYQIALYHDLVTQIRSGTTGQLPRSYSYLIHVGNSLGSEIGSNMATSHPEDFNAFVLTGFSKSVIPSLPGVALNLPAPGVLVNPTRFAGLEPGYVTSTLEASLTNSFFGNPKVVDFDPEVAHLFFQRRDVVSIGDVITTYDGQDSPPAPAYKGRVLVLTGENDQAFCGLGSSVFSPDTQCGSLLKDTGSLYPNADYNYQAIPRSGHALLLHKSAPQTLRIAHEFIAGASFGK